MRVVTVAGTRPELIKLAPLVPLLDERFDHVYLFTGQHFSPTMVQVFIDELQAKAPGRMLDVRESDPDALHRAVLPELRALAPQIVIVYGDTNSTLAAARAARELGAAVVHVEAGIRSFDRSMPEERARVEVDRLSHLRLAPTGLATYFLDAFEGLDPVASLAVGNLVVDAWRRHRPLIDARPLHPLIAADRDYAVLTLHRQATVDDPAVLGRALRELGRLPFPILFPVHPRTQQRMASFGLRWPDNLRACEPIGYLDFCRAMSGASVLLTDSGGVQEEAITLSIPCVTLRPNTERMETVFLQGNRLFDLAAHEGLDRVVAEARAVTERPYVGNPYGDGHSAERITAAVECLAGRAPTLTAPELRGFAGLPALRAAASSARLAWRGVAAAFVLLLSVPVAADAGDEVVLAMSERLRACGTLADEKRTPLAEQCWFDAGAAGLDPQRQALGLGRLYASAGWYEAARAQLEFAGSGADAPLADEGRAALKALPPSRAGKSLDAGYAAKRGGDLDRADRAFERAGADGADPQLVALERGYLAAAMGRGSVAKRHFLEAAEGPDARRAAQARAEANLAGPPDATALFDAARAFRADGRPDAATDRLNLAYAAGHSQTAALELAWLALETKENARARLLLRAAMDGADASLADAARRQLEAMPDFRQEKALEAAYSLAAQGRAALAVEAFEAARVAGVDPQRIDIEIGWLLDKVGDKRGAASAFEAAAAGPDAALAKTARDALGTLRPQLAEAAFTAAREARQDGRYTAAAQALDEAAALGADPARVSLERGFLDGDRGRVRDARASLSAAARDGDEAIAREAKARLRGLPRPIWADLYGEAFGWHRFAPAAYRTTNLVPTLRARLLFHPIPGVEFDPYLFAQISRDVASRGDSGLGYPLIYADNTLMLGGGLLFRFLKRHLGVFVQAGPAINLLADGRERAWFDFRAGFFGSGELPTCRPEAQLEAPSVRPALDPCADVYGEAVYVSRFDHNVFLSIRGRAALTLLVTGPFAWQPFAEARLLKDIRNVWWNNLADVGAGFRWRLLVPFGLDLMLGVHGGSYLPLPYDGTQPTPLSYGDLRLQLAAYVAF